MGGVRIVTDSACDLTAEEAADLDVTIVPLSIRFGDEEFTDRVDLSVEDFYAKMAASSALPETAAPAPGAFEQAFRDAAEAGAEAVVCIDLSSQLSATMQSAQTATKAFEGDLDVRVLDSASITSGLGTQVTLAARAAKDGAGANDIEALLDDLRPRTRVFGALDTLDNLKKGGRIGGAQAMLGTMLSIKPIIDISTGKVEEAAKQRTRKKAMQWLHQKLRDSGEIEQLHVMHGDAPDIDEFLEMLAPDFPRDTIHVGKIGAVIGTHGGPRVLGVTYLVT